MTVRKEDRTPTDNLLKLQSKAYELCSYSLRAASNEKVVPKRLRWCCGNFLSETSHSICDYIDKANSIQLGETKALDDLRRKEQELAKGSLFSLLTNIHICYYTNKFESEKLAYWVEQVEEVLNLLKAWIKSDEKRRVDAK